MKQTCSDQLTDELVTATEKTTTNQLERSAQLRTRVTQTAASIEPNNQITWQEAFQENGNFCIFRKIDT